MSTDCDDRRSFLKAVGFGVASLSVSRWLSADEGVDRPWLVGYADAEMTPKPGSA